MNREDEVRAVFAAYQRHHPRAKLDAKRRSRIEDRLKDGYTIEELAQAIDGCHGSEWHRGQNDRGRRYTGLELILRDADHVEEFIALGRPVAEPKPANARQNRTRTYGI